MAGRKRTASGSNLEHKATSKRARSSIQAPGGDDDLEAVLLLIKQQEESEALARQLQDEWDEAVHASGSSQASIDNAPGTKENGILVGSEDGSSAGGLYARLDDEDESEALARQLQAEWDKESGPSGISNNEAFIGKLSGTKGNGILVGSEDEHSEGDPKGKLDDEIQYLGRQTSGVQTRASVASPSQARKGKRVASRSAPSSSSRVPSSSTISPHSLFEESETPPDRLLLQYRDLFTASRECTKCKTLIESPLGFVSFSAHTPPPSLLFLLHAPCPSCKTVHCRGCFKQLPCTPACRGKDKNPSCPAETCCAEVRAIALFEALSGFDRQYINERNNSDQRAKTASKTRRGASSVGPGGTGYGMGSSGGYHRGRGRGRGHGAGSSRGGYQQNSPGSHANTSSLADHWEEVLVRVLVTVTSFLPSPYDDSAKIYDMLPHPSIQPLLSLSQLPDLLASLLRNDSVTDWINRVDIYNAMLRLLRRLADCELTIDILIGRRWQKKDKTSVGIAEWMWQDGDIEWEVDQAEGRNKGEKKRIVMASPLYDYFRKLTKQSEAFLTGASQLMDGHNSEAAGAHETEELTVKATSLCGDIIAARDDIERTMAVLGRNPESQASATGLMKGKGKGRDPAVDMEKEYSTACERLAFRHVVLGPEGNYSSFNYAPNLTQTDSSTRNPKDRLHLIKELAIMATCLPPGVWVRVDEVRNDAIKIMIAGPEGTPYAGGLFEFDCFMPLEYPNKPPLVHLRTTGGGRVRFNPNLYNSGKVCLSLLGTWLGRPEEQWSSKSTLLQVLVSIQSMILVDAPFFNEPGYGRANPKDQRSISYNRNIALQTVRWAIVEWMNDEHKNSVWADVIASHFTIRQSKIRKCIQDWAVKDPSMRSYDPSTTGYAGSDHAPGANLYGMRTQPLGKKSATTIDLISQFDQGLKKVQTWLKSQEEE